MAKFIILLSLLLSACGSPGSQNLPIYLTHPQTEKIGPFLNDVGEMTPIVWNGELLAVIRTGQNVEIRDVFSKALVSTISAPNFDLICALVENGTLYIFGTTSLDQTTYQATPGNAVEMISSTDLMTWTTLQVVYQAPSSMTIYNTSVSPDPTGYVMVLEVQETGHTNLHERFAHSPDLSTFVPMGGVLNLDTYSSCPTIRYVNGQYYVIHDVHIGSYYMAFISRSSDLITWEDQKGNYVPFSPVNGPTYENHNGVQAINNSDVDLVEYNGYVYFLYNYGDQATWGGYGIASYQGTVSDYVKLFF